MRNREIDNWKIRELGRERSTLSAAYVMYDSEGRLLELLAGQKRCTFKTLNGGTAASAKQRICSLKEKR